MGQKLEILYAVDKYLLFKWKLSIKDQKNYSNRLKNVDVIFTRAKKIKNYMNLLLARVKILDS